MVRMRTAKRQRPRFMAGVLEQLPLPFLLASRNPRLQPLPNQCCNGYFFAGALVLCETLHFDVFVFAQLGFVQSGV